MALSLRLDERVLRDADDHAVLACMVAALADLVVSDNDLLVLQSLTLRPLCDPSAPDPSLRPPEEATAMMELVVKLPDDLAQRARNAGLLSDSAIQRLLEEAMRREAGRNLLAIAERMHAAGIPPMTDEEIAAEVKAVRAERRAAKAQDPKLGS